MRLIIGIALLLLGLGTLSCRLDSAIDSSERTRPTFLWVRTADGWEWPGSWLVTPVKAPRLHPFVVAAGQGLASVLALAAFRRDDE